MSKQIYIAAPFFNEEQQQIVSTIETTCEKYCLTYFSPMKECMYEPGVTKAKDILDMNIKAIDTCSFLVAVTNGKDVGTLFESGYAYAKGIKIIYIWLDPPENAKFNLMLEASGLSVCLSWIDLEVALQHIVLGHEFTEKFSGELE